jgi:hypothetical protein
MASSDSPGDEREVFAGLPNARPHRRSAKRDRAGVAPRGQAGAASAAKPAAKRTPAADAARTPPPAAEPVPPAGWATPTEATSDRPHGTDLITTTVQAVGELAEIVLRTSARAIKSAIQRLPRP